jgi:hypothetical protein
MDFISSPPPRFSASKAVSYALLGLAILMSLVIYTGRSQVSGLDDYTDKNRARAISSAANYAETMGVPFVIESDLAASIKKLIEASKTHPALTSGPTNDLQRMTDAEVTHSLRFLRLERRRVLFSEVGGN